MGKGSWDLLKGIFKDAIKIDFRNFININITVNGGHRLIKNDAYIDFNELSDEQKRGLENSLKEELESGTPILEQKFSEEGDEYAEYIETGTYEESLNFFKGKISKQDHKILKAAYYLRSHLEAGKETFRLKQDITQRYGERGRNISNLCSGGYFESYIRPLYEEMQSLGNFKQEEFLAYYNDIIEQSPFALFVNTSDTTKKVEERIKKKIEGLGKYGIKQLNVHGIGNICVKSIREAIANIEKEDGLNFQKRIREEGKIIIVQLEVITPETSNQE